MMIGGNTIVIQLWRVNENILNPDEKQYIFITKLPDPIYSIELTDWDSQCLRVFYTELKPENASCRRISK